MNVGFNLVPAMLSHEVAATLGGFWNYEAIQLQLLHKHPTVIPIDQAGVPSYDELVLVVRAEEAHHDGVDLRAFMQALTRGERAVRANPAAAAKLDRWRRTPASKRSSSWSRSNARCRPRSPPKRASPTATRTRPSGRRSAQWMYAKGLLKNNPNATGLPPFTNEFLPGEGI